VNVDKLANHLQREKYGDFWLTEAVRPALNLQVIPQEGFRIETYRDDRHDLVVPVLAASVSRERLFDVFLEMVEPLGDLVDVVLETSHDSDDGKHRDLCREHIDRSVLTSHFCDFEDLLLHDGCTGLAVISTTEPLELQFDEHKLLLVYGQDLLPFQRLLQDGGVRRKNHMQLLTEGAHLHNTHPRHLKAFQQLCYRLGVGEMAEQMSW